MASPGIMSSTRAVDVSIHAAVPVSMGISASCAKRSEAGIKKMSNSKKNGRRAVFIRWFSGSVYFMKKKIPWASSKYTSNSSYFKDWCIPEHKNSDAKLIEVNYFARGGIN